VTGSQDGSWISLKRSSPAVAQARSREAGTAWPQEDKPFAQAMEAATAAACPMNVRRVLFLIDAPQP